MYYVILILVLVVVAAAGVVAKRIWSVRKEEALLQDVASYMLSKPGCDQCDEH